MLVLPFGTTACLPRMKVRNLIHGMGLTTSFGPGIDCGEVLGDHLKESFNVISDSLIFYFYF